MIIQCDKCKTKFRLDDSRVKGRGVRVKCTKCLNLFVVTPPPPPVKPEPTPEPEHGADHNVQPPLEDRGTVSSSTPDSNEHPPAEKEPAPVGSDGGEEPTRDSAIADAGEDKEGEEEPSWGDAFGEEEGAAKDDGKGEEPTWDSALAEAGAGEDKEDEEEPSWGDAFGEEEGAAKDEDKGEEQTWDSALAEAGAGEDKEDEEEPSWGDAFGEEEGAAKDEDKGEEPTWDSALAEADAGEGSEEPVEAGGDEPASDETDAFTFATGEIGDTPAIDSKDGDFDFAPDEDEAEAEPQAQPKPESSDESPQPLLLEDDDGEGDSSEEFIIEEEDEGKTETSSTKGSKVKLLLLIIVVVIGAGFYFTGGADKLSALLASKESVVQPKPLDIVKLKAYPLDNPSTGGLFVIEGRIVSVSDHPVPVKGIKGVLFNKNGVQVAAKVVSPGRVVSKKRLASISKEDLEKRFRGKTNAQIPSKGSVPFMVVFQESIAGLDEYTVEVLR